MPRKESFVRQVEQQDDKPILNVSHLSRVHVFLPFSPSVPHSLHTVSFVIPQVSPNFSAVDGVSVVLSKILLRYIDAHIQHQRTYFIPNLAPVHGGLSHSQSYVEVLVRGLRCAGVSAKSPSSLQQLLPFPCSFSSVPGRVRSQLPGMSWEHSRQAAAVFPI